MESKGNLSVVVCTWHRNASMLLNSVHTLSNQTVPPLEILVVDANTDNALIAENTLACEKYPLVKILHCPQKVFNLAQGMNVGIKRAAGEYIMATCMEMLFSPTVVECVMKLAAPNHWIQSKCGILDTPMGNVETVHTRWSELLANKREGTAVRVSAGAIMVAHRGWWNQVRGYDELYYPFENPDADLDRKALFTGLVSTPVSWDECQMLHPTHAPIVGAYQKSSEWFFSSNNDIVRNRERNPNGWGDCA